MEPGLPTELLLPIMEHLASMDCRRTLLRFLLASHGMYELGIRCLLRDANLAGSDRRAVSRFTVDSLQIGKFRYLRTLHLGHEGAAFLPDILKRAVNLETLAVVVDRMALLFPPECLPKLKDVALTIVGEPFDASKLGAIPPSVDRLRLTVGYQFAAGHGSFLPILDLIEASNVSEWHLTPLYGSVISHLATRHGLVSKLSSCGLVASKLLHLLMLSEIKPRELDIFGDNLSELFARLISQTEGWSTIVSLTLRNSSTALWILRKLPPSLKTLTIRQPRPALNTDEDMDRTFLALSHFVSNGGQVVVEAKHDVWEHREKERACWARIAGARWAESL
jgi:hypothetical protein